MKIMTLIVLVFVVCIAMGTTTLHATASIKSPAVFPVITPIFPETISVGDVFVINYTYAWFAHYRDTGIEPVTDEDEPMFLGDTFLGGTLLLPHGFSIITDVHYINFTINKHSHHPSNIYLIDLHEFPESGSGSIKLKYEKELIKDIDYMAFGWKNGSSYLIKQGSEIQFIPANTKSR